MATLEILALEVLEHRTAIDLEPSRQVVDWSSGLVRFDELGFLGSFEYLGEFAYETHTLESRVGVHGGLRTGTSSSHLRPGRNSSEWGVSRGPVTYPRGWGVRTQRQHSNVRPSFHLQSSERAIDVVGPVLSLEA